MITAARLAGCRGSESVIALFRDLGYDGDVVDIDLAEWQRLGLTARLEDATCRHIARVAPVDLILIEGRAEESERIAMSRWLNQRNIVNKIATIYYDSLSRQLCLSFPHRDRIRHLTIDLDRPTLDAIDRLNLLDVKSIRDDVVRLFDRALDREAVTKQFFRRFRSGVQAIRDVLLARCRGESQQECAGEALLILSRLLFLSYVQQKGWLDRRKRFLSEELDRAADEGRSYFDTVLLPLFFGCLNTPRQRRLPEAFALGDIPYLNGGLFEPSRFELRNLPFSIPDLLMRELFDYLFDRYSFRVDESDAGTDIDPEMLGKVFESLMEEDERATSGSFYTPRAIVDVLSQRCIIEWLGRNRRERTELESLLSTGNCELTNGEAVALISRLDTISVLDPACGSGAFLLSALQTIERLHEGLAGLAARETPPNLRQRIVERSLYGVDLKSEAVRLCELRLWLAIVSKSTLTVGCIPPLPNLDRNILQGNTLLTPTDFLGAGRREIYRDWIQGLRAQGDLVARYRSGSAEERPKVARELRDADRSLAIALLEKTIERDETELAALSAPMPRLFDSEGPEPSRKSVTALAERIAETRATLDQIRRGDLDFFAFDVHFAHVMSHRGGFDVILGNPPWVRTHRVAPAVRRMCADRYRFYGGSRGFDQTDLSIAFFERALGLMAPRGVLSLLLPSKVATADYAARLRQHLLRETTVASIDDWSDGARRLFDADTFPMGITVRNERPRNDRTRVHAGGDVFVTTQSDLGSTTGSPWSLAPPEVRRVFRRLRHEMSSLSSVLHRRPVMGVKTGANRCFFFERVTLRNGVARVDDAGVEIPRDALARCIRGRDVRRWRATDSTWLLWPPIAGWSNAPKWARALAEHFGISPDRLRLAYVRPEHLGIKVAWKDLSQGLQAVVIPATSRIDGVDFPLVPNQTLYSLDATSMDEAFVLSALLNSTVVNALAASVADRAKDSHFRYFGATIASLPFPNVRPESPEWSELVRLARRAHRGDLVDLEIDAIVNDLYRLARDEAKHLRAYAERRLGHQ